MNPAIGRGLPATAHPLENHSRKQAGSTTDAAGFQEALSGDENSPQKQKTAEKRGDPGSNLFRWTLPQRLNTDPESRDSGAEEQPPEAVQAWHGLKFDEPTTVAVGSSEDLGVAMAPPPASRDPKEVPVQTIGDATTLKPVNTMENAAPLGNEPSLSPRLDNEESVLPASPLAAERPTDARNSPERSLPEKPVPHGKENVLAGERSSTAAHEPKAPRAAPHVRTEPMQSVGNEGSPRDNFHQQQQAHSQHQPEIRVVSIQRAPAPVSEQVTATRGVASGETSSLHLPQQSEAGRMVQSLKIQLHPADLGMVTARLRIVADQLTVDLQVENAEARNRLGADSDSIVKALRSLGYDIDRVTVQQSLPGGQSNITAGTNTRDGGFHSLDNGQSENGRSHDKGNERSGREQPGHSGRPTRESGDVVQGGLYI